MFYGKVIGTVVATKKDEKLKGHKLLVVQKVNYKQEIGGDPIVAIDYVRAGVGDFVFLVKSKDASWPTGLTVPADAGIIGIIDTVNVVEK